MFVLDRPMSLWEHLQELRKRLLICVLTLVVTTVFAFVVAERWIFPILQGPAPDSVKFLTTEPTGLLGPYMKVSLVAGAILAMPMFVYQFMLFFSPALKPNEKRYLYTLLPAAVVAFGGGVAFGYFVLLPPALRFLYTFGSDLAEIRPNLGTYVSMVTTLLFWLGVVFETPLIIYFLARIGLVTPAMLSRFRRWAILGAFLLGAIITPTLDPVNQTLVAVPLIALYELGIWLARLASFQRRRAQRASVQARGELAH